MSSTPKYTLINPVHNILNITKYIPTKIIYYTIITIIIVIFMWMLLQKDKDKYELTNQDIVLKLKHNNNDTRIEIAKNEEEDVYEVVGFSKNDNYNYINP